MGFCQDFCFCGGSEKSRFEWLRKVSVENFPELLVQGTIICFFYKFLILPGCRLKSGYEYAMFQNNQQWNPYFPNPRFFDPAGNSDQQSSPSPQSTALILSPISRTFRFLKAIFFSLRGSKNRHSAVFSE